MGEGSRVALLEQVAQRARQADVFGEVRIEGDRLVCTARDAEEPAEYRLDWDEAGGLWVSLVTANRWLSESIETDLLHTGDKIEDLILDELVDLGYDGPAPRVEHFRSDDMLFTFRSPVRAGREGAPDAHAAATTLLAYEACFRQLGDMSGAGEEG